MSASPNPSSSRLLSDTSHPATPLLSHPPSNPDAYTEKELDDALEGLPSPASWSHATSWRPSRTLLSRRTIALALLCATGLLLITAGAGGEGEHGEESYLGSVREGSGKLKEAVKGLGTQVWEMANGPGEVQWVGFDKMQVLNFEEPQEKMKQQLKKGVRYATSAAYGGHANQFISIFKLLYIAKLTNRVAIIPTLLPVHFDASAANLSDFYNLDRFYDESLIPSVEWSALKPWDETGRASQNENLSCWSTQEATTGGANLAVSSLDVHRIWVNHWALPPLARGAGGFDIAYDALRMFDFDKQAQAQWVEKVRREALPQNPRGAAVDVLEGEKLKQNVKEGFEPYTSQPPTDQLLCLDNTLFIGPVMFQEAFAPNGPQMEPTVGGEGLSWINAGQYLHFTSTVSHLTDLYLMQLFDVATPSKIPPFITIHLRRGDFKDFGGLTALEKYTAALVRVRAALQARLEDPYNWRGPGRKHFRSFGIQASQYAVVTTTDEKSGSPFLDEVKALGWRVVDHAALGTAEKYGGWWPTMLDGAILSRGQAFVGTPRSTFSHLAGLRVKYWRGGLVESAF